MTEPNGYMYEHPAELYLKTQNKINHPVSILQILYNILL